MNSQNVKTQESDIEVALLACLVSAAAANRPDVLKKGIAAIKTSDIFVRKEHRLIYEGIRSLTERTETFDLALLVEELKTKGNYDHIDTDRLSELFNEQVELANAEEYARLVVKEYVRRSGVIWTRALAVGLTNHSHEPAELLTQAKSHLENLIEKCATEEAVCVAELVDEVVQQIESPDSNLLPTGFQQLDELVGGVMPGEFVVLAARPSMGKTSFALCMARNLACGGVCMVFVSLEVRKEQFTRNLLIIDSGVKSHVVRKLYAPDISDTNWERIQQSRERIKSYPILVTDKIGKTSDIYANLSSLIAKHNVKVAFIDYLQLIAPPKGNSLYERVTETSRELKKMAKDLGISVVVLAQLNRGPEHRENNRPLMADLRDSGAIEQDADQVWLLHRPGYYNEHTDQSTAELSVAKNRTGPTGKVNLVWRKEIMRFEDPQQQTEQD